MWVNRGARRRVNPEENESDEEKRHKDKPHDSARCEACCYGDCTLSQPSMYSDDDEWL